MKAAIFSLGLCAATAQANIVFHWVQPTCDFSSVGPSSCLEGQVCAEGNVCVPDLSTSRNRYTSFSRHAASEASVDQRSAIAAPRTDGRCGNVFGGATCDPKGVYGGCCSQYGYCGSTSAHCSVENGCQSGCSAAASSAVSSKPAASSSAVAKVVSSSAPASSKTASTSSPVVKAAGSSATTSSKSAATSSAVVKVVSSSAAASSKTASTSSPVAKAASSSATTSSKPVATSSSVAKAASSSAPASSKPATTSSAVVKVVSSSAAASSKPATTSSAVVKVVSSSAAASSTPATTSSSVVKVVSSSAAASSTPATTSSSVVQVVSSSAAASSTPATISSAVVNVVSSSAAAPSGTSTAPRSDGRCGKDFGGATCDPKGGYGGCCSQYGYCGTTTDHCLVLNGCQSGCSDAASSSGSSASSSTSGSATTNSPVSKAVSSPSSVQSSSTQEPVLATSRSSAAPTATGKVTTDGSCGASYGGTICGDWATGGCCSMYGYCGNTSSHCGSGCQSGPCLSAPAVAAPGASPAPAAPTLGSFRVVGDSGVPVMHAGLLPNGKVAFLDKVENYTQVKLSDGQYAYSAEYDTKLNTYVPLSYKTNSFCAGGAYLADGTFLALGGNAPLAFVDPTVGDGFDGIRYLKRSINGTDLDGQNWSEPGNKLASKRWYPSAQTLADGSVFVASGSLNGLDPSNMTNNNPTWELLNAQGISDGINRPMEILVKNQPYYMYPFMHLMADGSLYVFVSKSSELFDIAGNKSVKMYPDLPGEYRTYPNTGGSVMLPLSSANNWNADVMICGGGAYQDISAPTDPSCGRISPMSANPTWEMDSMPEGRGMVEGTLLPDGTVLWLNGCNKGAQGFGLGQNPTFDALLYNPTQPLGKRFSTAGATTIPRLYHSVALLLLDGTVMVTGSNPVEQPVISPNNNTAFPYDTEFRVEIYTPPYLMGNATNLRPLNISLSTLELKAQSSFNFKANFNAPVGAKDVKIVLYHGGFVTHSVHMGARMIYLDFTGWKANTTAQELTISGPPSLNVAPPGPYVVYVVVDGVPGIGNTVLVS